MSKKKLYCYVDESGQDTQGKLFVVAVIVTYQDKEKLLKLCESFEKVSGKRKDKWGPADYTARIAYLSSLLLQKEFTGNLFYKVSFASKEYDEITIQAIYEAVALRTRDGNEYAVRVYVDGLSKTKRRQYGPSLRQRGIFVKDVRGIAKDETNALIRFADAIAGSYRDIQEHSDKEIKRIFSESKKKGILTKLP